MNVGQKNSTVKDDIISYNGVLSKINSISHQSYQQHEPDLESVPLFYIQTFEMNLIQEISQCEMWNTKSYL